jgi:Putative Flp pilus-assembly TadE/G-like
MFTNSNNRRDRFDERGSALVMLAGLMVALLGMSALAIDLAALYATRAEAQRAADAAALAAAQTFASSGCTSGAGGCVAGGPQESVARQRAQDVGAQNFVAGEAANVQAGDVSFTYPNAEEPQITVLVARDAAHGNSIPTVFGKIFGVQTVDVSVSATAEAFNPSGSGVPIGSSCLKPWVLPNCDSGHTTPATNPNCGGFAPFIDPASGTLVNPGPVSSGGVIGETVTLKPGSPSSAPAPSQFYAVDLPPALTQPSLCPACANGSMGGGAALYRSNISCCNETSFLCGPLPIPMNIETGNMQGPTQQGVECLINEQNNGSGQDILVSAWPLSITGGSFNSNPLLRNVTGLTQSSSIATAPLYDGHNLCPGGSCGGTVQIIGFLQVFINNVIESGPDHGSVTATILNVAGCGSNAAAPTVSSPTAAGGSIPIRLIRQ